jgi:photosystem II stability/assembly factor-like uncharacterized protein
MKRWYAPLLVILAVAFALSAPAVSIDRPASGEPVWLSPAARGTTTPNGVAVRPASPGARTILWEPTGGIDGGYIPALAATPRGTLLAGTEGGLFRSVDGGDSWTPSDAGLPWPCCNYNIFALAATATSVYAGTWGGGVVRSDDDAESWMPTAAIPNDGYPVVQALAACRYGEEVYAGGSFGVVRSTDGGASWETINDGLPATWVKKLALRGTIPYALMDDGVYRLDLNHRIWEPWNEGLYATTGQQSLDLVDDALFLATHQGGVFHLDCADSEWVAMNDGLVGDGVDVVTEAGGRLYVGLMGGAVKRWNLSTYAWDWIGGGLWNPDVRTMTGSSLTPYAGTYGAGVFRFDPYEESWSQATAGIRAPGIEALVAAGSTVHAALFGGGIYVSTDNGDTWNLSIDGLGEISGEVFALSLERDAAGNVYAGTWNGVWKQAQPDAPWTAAGMQGSGVFSLLYRSGVLYGGAYGGGVYASSDGGQTWDPVGTGLPEAAVWSIAQSGATLYAAVAGSGVYRFEESMSQWEAINAGLPGLDAWCVGASGGEVFVGLGGNGVHRWNAGTESWDAAGLQDAFIFCLTDIGTGLLAGTYGALYLTGDGGETWTNESDGLKEWSPVAAITASEESLYAGLTSAGVWRAPRESGGVEPGPEADAAIPLGTMLVRPNPFTQGARVLFRLDRPQTARLSVYDATGRLVTSLVSGELPAGPHERTWDGTTADGARAAAGVYLVRLEVGGKELRTETIRLR